MPDRTPQGGGRCVFALTCLIALILTSALESSVYGQFLPEPVFEWTRRHPDPMSSPPALADRAVGSDTDGSFIYSVYEQRVAIDQAVARVVKYDINGSIVAQTTWPSLPVDQEFTPRAMKIASGLYGTRVFVVADRGKQGQSVRTVVTMAFDTDLNQVWEVEHSPPPPYPDYEPEDYAVALDANELWVGVVARVLVKEPPGWPQYYAWGAFVFDHSGAYAMPQQYYEPPDQSDWPVSVSLSSGAIPPTDIVILGQRSQPDGLHFMQVVFYDVAAQPTERTYLAGIPASLNIPVKIVAQGSRHYIGGSSRPSAGTSFGFYVGVFDWVAPASWHAGYLGNHGNDILHDIHVGPSLGDPSTTSFSGSTEFPNGTFFWVTGSSAAAAPGTTTARTMQFRDVGNDPWFPTAILVDRDWEAFWAPQDHSAAGMLVRSRDTFDQQITNPLTWSRAEVYICGTIQPSQGWPPMREIFVQKYNALRPAQGQPKDRVWEIGAIAPAGEDDRPVSFVERQSLGRRFFIGGNSFSSQTHDDMVTILYEDRQP